MALSNALPLLVSQPPPAPGAGVQVRVLPESEWHRAGTPEARPIAVITRWVELSVTREVRGAGAGSITLDLDDRFWRKLLPDGRLATALLDQAHLYEVWEDGVWKGDFLGEVRPDEPVKRERTVVIAGPGGAAALTRAVVMTPHFPGPPPPSDSDEPLVFEFTNTAQMGAWLHLLAVAQGRGTCRFVRPTFTATADSNGAPWIDNPPPPPVPGENTQTLSADVLFAINSAVLQPAALSTIDAIVYSVATMQGPRFTVVGHASSDGAAAYNQTLSEQRAAAVRNRIKALRPDALVTAYGEGERRPIAPNDTEWGRRRNRRVAITYPVPRVPVEPTVYSPPLGINLLDLLVEMSGEDPDQPSPIRVEWKGGPGFTVDVAQTFGVDRSAEVVFYEGSRQLVSVTRERRSDGVRNYIAVQNADLQYAVAVSAASVAQWGQRELYVRQGGEHDARAHADMAQTMLRRDQAERGTWTVKVEPYGAGRHVGRDYDLGDWIAVSRFVAGRAVQREAFRVLATTMRWRARQEPDLELLLQSRAEAAVERLRRRLTSLIHHLRDAPKVWITDREPIGARPGDFWTPRSSSGGGYYD